MSPSRRSNAASHDEPLPPPGEAVPLVSVTRAGQRCILAAVDRAAWQIGLRPGQTVAQAQAQVPGLILVEAEPEEDRNVLREIATWCLRYTPLVEADEPDGIWLDIEGATHLFSGEEELLADIRMRLDRVGFTVRTALAGTKSAAAALARRAPGAVLRPGAEREALSPLSIGCLRIEPDIEKGLRLLGIEQIGDLRNYPRSQLALRFGPALLARLDRALGDVLEPLTALAPATMPRTRLAFAEPLGTIEGLAAVLARLAPVLCAELARRGVGLRLVDAVFRRVDGRPIAIRVRTAASSRDPAHLLRLLKERLAYVDPGFGIDEVLLCAPRVEPMRERQTVAASLREPREGDLVRQDETLDEEALAPLVDRLGVRLGQDRVFRVAPVESRVPERSVRRVPALAPPLRNSWPTTLPRPSRIVDPPEPVTAIALVPDDPPSIFFWRRARHVVRAADGPERVRGEWWRAESEAASLRDYYRVEDTSGHRFWLFRDAPMAENPRWWMHGRFG